MLSVVNMLPNCIYSVEQSISHDFNKRMVKRHFIRHQRSVDNMNGFNGKLPASVTG